MARPGNSRQDLVGRGGFGEVFPDSQHPDRVWKCPRKDKKSRSDSLQHEARVYLELLHYCPEAPFYPRLHSLQPTDAGLSLQLEKKGDTLALFFKKNPLPDEPLFCKTALRLFELLHKLHRTGVVHRDIKPSNILLAGSARTLTSAAPLPEFYLIDFGLSRKKCERNPRFEGTRKYASPWSCSAERNFSHLDDSMALLYLLSEWYSGEQLPWSGEKNISKIKRAKLEWDPAGKLPGRLRPALRLVQGLLEKGSEALPLHETHSLFERSLECS